MRFWQTLFKLLRFMESHLMSRAVKPISQARFEALCFSRVPTAKLYSRETEWYSDEGENVIGAVVFDLSDADWGFVVLGRDEVARFRAIEVEVSLPTEGEARANLQQKILQVSVAGEKMYPQGWEHKRRKVFSLFDPVIPPDQQDGFFKILSKGTGYSPAKEIIAEIAYTFEDPDGNYIQQFQGDGFDARLWELYLYAVLHESDFTIDREHRAPDFVCLKQGRTLVIEATTVNVTQERQTERTEIGDPDGTQMADYMAIKFGSPLFSKLGKRYWLLDHVRGQPLILAIADFEKPPGVHYSSKFLLEYLYGRRQVTRTDGSTSYISIGGHVFGRKTIPSGFFFLPDAENISAVLFSDAGTMSKFNRMGKLAGFGSSEVSMIRFGQRYERSSGAYPTEFRVPVSPPAYTETWREGIWLFHNPNARFPIDPEAFDNVAHAFWENEQFEFIIPDQHPVWSKTLIFSSEASDS